MKPWHTLSIEETQDYLQSLRGDFGPNRLIDREAVRWHTMLIRQFSSLLILILFIAAGLSFFMGDKIDALAILAVIILNALLGFLQEWKAETALKGLKKMLAPHCRVIRNGQETEINAEDLVPGDCVLLSAGNAVPADIRLSEAIDLKADEATLTGESNPVEKITAPLPENTPITDRTNMTFMGTHITHGHGRGFVVATGMDTEFGRIAELTSGIKETQTRLQRQLERLAKQLGALAVSISLTIIMIGIIGGRNVTDMIMTGIALAVSAVPEGLPAVVTITLALGVGIMARKKALLRHLQAAETLGAVSVICTDKTGTLTKNEMTVTKIWLPDAEISVEGAGYEPVGNFVIEGNTISAEKYPSFLAFLNTAQLCNHARIEKDGDGVWRAIGSPTEAALITAALKTGVAMKNDKEIIAEHSFSSERKRMSVVMKDGPEYVAHIKGAPEAILPRCSNIMTNGEVLPLDGKERERIDAAYTHMAREGLRTLALAQKNTSADDCHDEDKVEDDMVFLGIAGIIDPPRAEVKDALAKSRAAGIRVIVITGDSADTAQTIARQIGLDVDETLTSTVLNALNDEELSRILDHNVLFARTVPEDKFRIVKILQDKKYLVAMTGDGVNDAPALKQADIGIAMGIRGTDVAKGASDLVLLDDNFASIVAAIEEGRRQYANIRKFVRYLTSSNIGETLAIFINIIVGGPLILLPIQILWINLVTDSVTALSLSVEKAEKDTMAQPPRLVDKPLLDRSAFFMLALFGSYIGIVAFGLYWLYLDHSYALANTMAFTATVVMANIHTLNFRNLHGPISAIGWLSNPWLLIAFLAMLILQILAVYVPFLQEALNIMPLTATHWIVITLCSLPLFLIPEAYKTLRARG